MAGAKLKKLPYPPSPTDVPDDLTDYPATYRAQQNMLLAGLFLFLLTYLGLICLSVLVGVYCFMTVAHLAPLKILGMVLTGVFFLFLVKGFFKRTPIEKELHIEVTEEEQPVLFEFIRKLITELDAPEPNRVFVSLDVNAAVMPRTSLINLFKEPKKDLLIGLGLVNMLNLSEFKSVMAHEFGHFCQSAYASSYTYVAHRIIADLIEGEDWFDRMVDFCKRQNNALSAFGHVIGGMLWVGRKLLMVLFKAIILQRMAVSREQEFHADLCAVLAAGSDAVPLSLLRLRFGNMCLGQAVNDLRTAAEHKLYTSDIFYHQEQAATVVRRQKKDPKLGERPDIAGPLAGKNMLVFDPDEESIEDEEIPEMRRSHPSFPESEANAKETFVPGPIDIRSPWVLFADAAELKERITYKFYRMAMRIKKDTELEDAIKVQTFIDNEHAETTYDPKYHGLYDDRPLEPGDLAELNEIIRTSPWNEDRIAKVLEKLYEGAKGKAEEYADLRKERATLDNDTGEKSPRLKKKIKEVEAQLDKVWEWYKSLDRRVYLVHVQMAAAVNREWKDELVERYRFQVEVQKMYEEARQHQGKAFAFASALFNMAEPHPDFVAEVMHVLRQAWKALKNILRDAREVNLPAMKNFEEGERLADFILEGKLVSELPLTYVKGKWVSKLLDQLDMVRSRCFRLHWKSVGGILALQEKIATEWQTRREPVEAAVVEDAVAGEVVPAEVVPAEVVPAEVVDVAEVVPAEVVAAEVVDAAPVEAEVLDAAVVEEPPAAEVVSPPPPPEPAPVAFVSPEPEPVFVPPEPEPVFVPPEPEPVFVLPGSEPAPPPPAAPEPVFVPQVSEPAPPAPVVPAPVVAKAPELVAGPKPAAVTADDIFSLGDAADAHPEVPDLLDMVAGSAPVTQPIGDLFTLDADALKPKPAPVPPPPPPPIVVAKPVSPPPTPVQSAGMDLFSLDADDSKPAVPAMAARAQPSPPRPSGVVAAPAAKPVAAAPVGDPTTVTKPAKNGRPPIKITMVRPGQKSPLGA
jgi:Zn-dependent protease with chaperone function